MTRESDAVFSPRPRDTEPIVGPARSREQRLALSIRWSIVVRAAFSPFEFAERRRDISALIRAYFRIARLMACSPRELGHEANPNLSRCTMYVYARRAVGPILPGPAVRATINDTPATACFGGNDPPAGNVVLGLAV